MKRLAMLAVLLLAAAGATPLWAAGTVEEVTFYSDALGRDMPVQVYLPDGYDTSGIDYPAMTFLTDSVGVPAMTMIASHLDGMIGAGIIDPMIVVAIDGTCMPFAAWGAPMPMSSWWRNSELNGAWKDALVVDLVTWVDTASGYRTVADRGHRFLAGHFFGGGAAMLTALEFPDVFGSVVASAGNGALEVYQPFLPYMLATEYPGGPPYAYNPGAGPLSYQNFMLAAAFTPNITASPWPIDFWLDASGNLVPDIWQDVIDQTSPALAVAFAATGRSLDIYFDCDSQGMTAPACDLLHSTLEDLEVPHHAAGYTGQTLNDRMPIYLTFFAPLNATLELRPRVINARNWWIPVRASIELPGDLDAATIDPRTIAITAIDGVDLDEPIPAVGVPELTDLNGNGRTDLNVLFNKQQVLAAIAALDIPPMQPFDVTVEGETEDLLFLAATDSLRWVDIRAHNH